MRDNDHVRRLIRPVAGGLVLAVAGALALGAPAAGAAVARAKPPKTVYAVTFSPRSALYRIDPRSHAKTLVGRARAELTDLAFRGKTLYAISFTTLYRLNAKTGASHKVGSLGLSSANALVNRPKTSTLYGADQDGDFFKINARTGRVTIIGVFGNGFGSSGDLAFADGRLYATVSRAGRTSSLLATVNVRTGTAKVVGKTGYSKVYGLVTGRGALYGATFSGKFLAISRRTGRARTIWNEGIAVGGLTVPSS
jgi:hypothetical protein